MPTGYTEIIERGCTFEEYVWRCARAFGACVDMRDMPLDAVITDEIKPDPYYADKVAYIQQQLLELNALSHDEILERIKVEITAIIEQNHKYSDEYRATQQKYQEIKARVLEWSPPSVEHKSLKDFMLQQIEVSMDSGRAYQVDMQIPDVQEWLKKTRKSLDLEYWREEYAKEIKRTNERNLWLRMLRESVPQPKRIT